MTAHILMIVDTAPPLYGGAGTQAALLAEVLRSRGHRVEVVARQKERVSSSPESTSFVRPYVRNRRLSSGLFSLSVAWRVLTTRADVVHCHGAYDYAFVAVAIARLRALPSIVKVTLIGSDDPMTVAAKRIGPLHYGRLHARLFIWATRVIALNASIKGTIAEGAPSARSVVIPNGVRLRSQPQARISPTEPHVAYAGVLSKRKGIDTLLAAWPSFLARHPGATLTLIGPVRDNIAELIARSPIGVVATGLLPSSEVQAHLANATLFVLPSRHEGQPNSLIEAMSLGLASCASDIAANVETGADAAHYFAVGDSDSLSRALERTWNDRLTLAALGLKRANEFDITAIAERYSLLYAELGAPAQDSGYGRSVAP